MITLPELPFKVVIDIHTPTGLVIRGYTEEKMRQYGQECAEAARKQTLEECAKFLDRPHFQLIAEHIRNMK